MPPKAKKINPSALFKQENVGPTAIVVANDVSRRFKPLSKTIPHCLLPLGTVPLLHFPLSRLICDGFQNILILACRGRNKIEQFIVNNEYRQRVPSTSIKVIGCNSCRSTGDVMRFLERGDYLRGVEEFIYLRADLICEANLNHMLTAFKQIRTKDPSAALGLVYSDLPDFMGEGCDRLSVAYSTPDMKLHQLFYTDRDLPLVCTSRMFKAGAKANQVIRIRTHLIDSCVLLCSSHVPPLFCDEFDFHNINELIHGIVTNQEITGYSLHIQFAPHNSLAMPVAPGLKNLMDITPRLLARLGNRMIRPPTFLTTEPFSHITEGTAQSTKRRSPLSAVSPFCYVAKSAHINPSARLIGSCLIGERCHISTDVVLIDTVLGDDCTIEQGARLRGVTAVSNVSIGQNVVLDKCWLCPGVWILSGVRMGPRCFIGAPRAIDFKAIDKPTSRGAGVGVTIGPDVYIPPESIIVAPGPSDTVMAESECGSKGWAARYQPHFTSERDFFGDDQEDNTPGDCGGADAESEDSDDEGEVLLWRTNFYNPWTSRTRNSSTMQSRDENETPDRQRLKSGEYDTDLSNQTAGTGDSDSDPEPDNPDVSDDFLIAELGNTLLRNAELNQPLDVILLEVNSLKHAYNISLDDLAFFLIKALLILASHKKPDADASDAKAYAISFKKQIATFSKVLEKYLSSSDGTGASFCLQALEDEACETEVVMAAAQWLVHALYDADLVSEEAIRHWVTNSPLLMDEDLAEGCAEMRSNLAPFLKWLDEAEEDDSDE